MFEKGQTQRENKAFSRQAIAVFRVTRKPKFLLGKGFSHFVCPSPAQIPLYRLKKINGTVIAVYFTLTTPI